MVALATKEGDLLQLLFTSAITHTSKEETTYFQKNLEKTQDGTNHETNVWASEQPLLTIRWHHNDFVPLNILSSQCATLN